MRSAAYTAILVFPLTPPGNVLAFNLLNRYVPGATPSGFTRRRQDCDELFTEVMAADDDVACELPSLSQVKPARI